MIGAMNETSSPPSFDLRGQRVLVTGASSGIGAATALACAGAGAIVGAVARRADRLDDIVAQCPAGSKRFVVDLADPSAVDRLAIDALDGLGGVDIVVNNAGIPKRRTAVALSVADIDEVMAVNFTAPVRLTAGLLPSMLERGSGHIVNISSMGVHSLAYRVGAYAASKAAIELYTEALHLELAGTGVHAHLFIPGTTATEFSTPQDGNDPPFPQDPATTADSRDVAAALLACLATPAYRTFASDGLRHLAQTKEADVNTYIATHYERFAGRHR